jgi:DNA-directed RNA polymerase specialized sigma24 family protein
VRTAANTRVSWWRGRRREVPLAGHDLASADHRDGIETGVMVALGRLPARQREVITLRLLLDLDTETTAQVLGIAPGTVTAHLSRAISSLRAQLPTTNPQHHISEVTP